MSDIQSGPSVSCSRIFSMDSGISGSMALNGSTMKAVAIVAIETISPIFHPPRRPKLFLSRGMIESASSCPHGMNSFLRLCIDAYSIGGMNITGYEITVPYCCASSAEKPYWKSSTTRLPSSAPKRKRRNSMNIPPTPGR